MLMTTNNQAVSRRALFAALGAASLAPLLPAAAWGLTENDAQDLADRISRDVVAAISSEGADREAEFKRIFRKYADVARIARSVLGPAGRKASKAQHEKFRDALVNHLARSYSGYFDDFGGGSVKVVRAKKNKSGWLVSTIVTVATLGDFKVDWHIIDKSGPPLIFNVYFEGINLVSTGRAEVKAMLEKRNGDIDKLIADMLKGPDRSS